MPHIERPAVDRVHDAHDRILIVQFAADDVTADERKRASALVASCTECADLVVDLAALQVATRDLAAPVRPRDFRLTAEDAARARPSGWRGLVAAFTGSGAVMSRPLALGMVTLGLAGLFWVSIPGGFGVVAPASTPQAVGERNSSKGGGSSTAEAGNDYGVEASAPAPAAAAGGSPAVPPANPAIGGPNVQGGSQTTGGEDSGASSGPGRAVAVPVPSEHPLPTGAQAGPSPLRTALLTLGSLALVVTGSTLLFLRRRTRRARGV